MLRLPRFDVVAPDSIAEVVEAMQRPGARLVAGGTDLLPNLKHRLEAPALLVSLGKVQEITGVVVTDGVLQIGAGVTLSRVAADPQVAEYAPSLATAAGLVASPLIRNMGTLGGNLNLDTRCRYVNQTEFWRDALGGCLKSGGSVCHVVPKGRTCVAAMSSDCVPVLITLDASAVLVGPDGQREVALADYYDTDGVRHVRRDPREIMTQVRVPLPVAARRTAYTKWTVRKSIDFPLVSVALRFDLDADSVDARIQRAVVCVGVLAARPRLIKRTASVAGRALSDPATAQLLAALVAAQARPLPNVPYEAEYRHKMLPVYTRRAVERIVEDQ